jgi:predicted ATPase
MAYAKLTLKGYRGFSDTQEIQFAIPTGVEGSGLTFIVGPNNSGKSSVLEAIHALTNQTPPRIPENRRNTATDRRIEVALYDNKELIGGVRTGRAGGEPTEWFTNVDTTINRDSYHPSQFHQKIFVLPSRRHFAPVFGNNIGIERSNYMLQFQLPEQRGNGIQNFFARLIKIQDSRDQYDQLMRAVLNPVPRWHIEQIRNSNGQSYISVNVRNGTHDTDGLGEGVLSLMFIIDALYDSKPDDTIFIDEPELSLHPAIQRKLAALLRRFAKDRQIIISTHSPYFVNWESIFSGGALSRIVNRGDGTKVFSLQDKTRRSLQTLLNDTQNPHILGLEANEIFFQDEPVVLVEGQEDVMLYPKVLQQIEVNLDAGFFGWGTGGAQKMRLFSQLFIDLGFAKVVGILDGNQSSEADKLRSEFKEYFYCTIPAEDIRTKNKRDIKATIGLLDENHKVRTEHIRNTREMVEKINQYLGQVYLSSRPLKK